MKDNGVVPQTSASTDLLVQGLERYTLIVSYDGTNYSGFQRQSSSSSSPSNDEKLKGVGRPLKRCRPNSQIKKKIKNRGAVPTTVQETLEDALEFYTGLDRIQLKARFAGRTDRGVHARGQVVVVSLPHTIVVGKEGIVDSDNGKTETENDADRLWNIRKSINSRLPNDISIEDVSKCRNESFDPRLDAKRKQYSYVLRYRQQMMVATAIGNNNHDGGKQIHPICLKGGPQLLRTALDSNRVWLCPWALDDSKLKHYCQLLTGTHNFSPFVHKDARTTRDNKMTVDRLDYERAKFRDDEAAPVWEVRFLVEAKGFGRSQVRNMVGFLVEACRGSFKDLESSNQNWLWEEDPDRLAKRIPSSPACGLCLEHVIY